MTDSREPIVAFSHITMQFPGVLANDDVSLDVMPGEIFALVGENGAGKSTLMNILFGIQAPSAGTVTVKGQTFRSLTSAQAIGMGIGMVHQHFMLVPSFSVAQNIVLGDEPHKGVFCDMAEARRITRELVEEYGLQVPPDEPVGSLSVGLQQRVEILKTLQRGADILILDEPTAVLTPQETDELFDVIRGIVRDKGMTVIIITHKLGEVMAISHRVGVMRAGRMVGVYNTQDVDERILASLMVGKDVLLGPLDRTDSGQMREQDPAISVRELEVRDNRGLPAVRGMSFDVYPGEIVGIAGVEGNGQSELAEAVTGMRPIQGGEVRIFGRSVNRLSPGKIRALGLAHVPEDRLATGLSPQADVVENLLIGKERRPAFSFLGTHLRMRRARRYARKLSEGFDIRGGGLSTQAGSLSGGNMQKLVVAREFSFDARAMVIAQPTRGVDIGAMDFIHQQIMDRRNRGCAILLISADLDELFRLSDRMLTVFEGRITGEFDPAAATREEVGRCMMGAEARAAQPAAAPATQSPEEPPAPEQPPEPCPEKPLPDASRTLPDAEPQPEAPWADEPLPAAAPEPAEDAGERKEKKPGKDKGKKEDDKESGKGKDKDGKKSGKGKDKDGKKSGKGKDKDGKKSGKGKKKAGKKDGE